VQMSVWIVGIVGGILGSGVFVGDAVVGWFDAVSGRMAEGRRVEAARVRDLILESPLVVARVGSVSNADVEAAFDGTDVRVVKQVLVRTRKWATQQSPVRKPDGSLVGAVDQWLIGASGRLSGEGRTRVLRIREALAPLEESVSVLDSAELISDVAGTADPGGGLGVQKLLEVIARPRRSSTPVVSDRVVEPSKATPADRVVEPSKVVPVGAGVDDALEPTVGIAGVSVSEPSDRSVGESVASAVSVTGGSERSGRTRVPLFAVGLVVALLAAAVGFMALRGGSDEAAIDIADHAAPVLKNGIATVAANEYVFDGVVVDVPTGAIAPGDELTIGTADIPEGSIASEVFGTPVGIEHSLAIGAPIEVRWDIGDDPRFEPATVALVTWDEVNAVWVPNIDPAASIWVAGNEVVASVPSWSFSSFVADTGQRVGEWVGKRAPEPECDEGDLPDWVNSIVDPDLDSGASSIRACFEAGPNDSVTVRIVNNRNVTQRQCHSTPHREWGSGVCVDIGGD